MRWQGQLHRAPLRKAPSLVSCSATATLNFLILLSLNLYFLSEVLWDRGSCGQAEEMYSICVSGPPATPLASNVPCVWWAQNSGGRHLREVGEPQNEDEVSVVGPRLSGGTDGPKGRAFYLNWNLLSAQKEGNGIKRNKKDLGNLSHPFSFVLLPCVSQALKLKVVTEKERKNRATHAAFACSLTHQ